jgi:hypothetical protein
MRPVTDLDKELAVVERDLKGRLQILHLFHGRVRRPVRPHLSPGFVLFIPHTHTYTGHIFTSGEIITSPINNESGSSQDKVRPYGGPVQWVGHTPGR